LDGPSTLPLSLPGVFAPCSDSPVRVRDFGPPPSIMGPMSVFWHRVCRWITNCFSSNNLACLHREACLPPLPILVRHQRRLAGLRLICSPTEINPATAASLTPFPPSPPTVPPQRPVGRLPLSPISSSTSTGVLLQTRSRTRDTDTTLSQP